MAKSHTSFWKRMMRMGVALLVSALVTVPPATVPAKAASSERSLYLFYTHTGETARITFKRNGKYLPDGLKKLNWFLRDWRRNEETRMDPKLFDLVWEVYQETGASEPINVVSAYRAPETNAMLRKTTAGVAKNSRHMKGMAMDFFIPGVPLAKLRAIAMKKQIGGVGYYPTSGSPFVHLDVGHVRAWPRMTTAQLKTLFPDGKTMHVPTNGVPLSNSGYQYAQAQWEKCHEVPCRRNTFGESSIRVASNDTDTGPKKTIFGMLFGGEDEEEDNADSAPATVQVASLTTPEAPANAPMDRPDLLDTPVANAPVPAALPAFRSTGNAGAMAVAAIDAQMAPQPHALLPGRAQASTMTAYAPAARSGPASAPQPATPPIYEIASDPIQTASVAGGVSLDKLGHLIESTWNSVTPAHPAMAARVQAAALSLGGERPGALFAPDFDHVTEVFMDPQPMTGERYAVIFEHDNADFSPATELGRYAGKASLGADPAWGLGRDSFKTHAPLLVASR